MIPLLSLMLACFGDADTPKSEPPPPPADVPEAAGKAAAPPAPAPAAAAASANPRQLQRYRGTFADDPLLTPSQVAMTAPRQHRTLRNEVFARYGRAFKSADLQAHFAKEPWYQVVPDFSEDWLTSNDRANVALIQRFEGDTEAKALKQGEYTGSMYRLVLVDAETAEVHDGSEDMYTWERSSRRWVALGDWVITWEGKTARWSPKAPGLDSIQLWELDHDSGSIESVTALEPLRG